MELNEERNIQEESMEDTCCRPKGSIHINYTNWVKPKVGKESEKKEHVSIVLFCYT